MYPPTSEVQLSVAAVELNSTLGEQQSPSSATPPGDIWLLDDRISILYKSAVQASPTQQIYRIASAVLTLVRNELIDDEDSVQLSEYCFNVCEIVMIAIKGKNMDDLSESARAILKELEKLLSEIERTLRRWADAPHTEYNKEEGDGHKLKIQRMLYILSAPGSPLNEDGVGGCAPCLAPIGPQDNATASISGESAFRLLIKREFDQYKLPLLVEAIFSNKNEWDILQCLHGDDAQTFVDVIDEALPDLVGLSLQIRKRCLRSLYKVCGDHAVVPRAMRISVRYDRTCSALFRGGFADVWKGECSGRDVAVKVLRTYSNSDLQRTIGRFCKEVITWKTLRHPNVLPLIGVAMSENHFAMVSDWMVNGNINNFVKAHPDANRIELLEDVARGLIYIHDQGMCHGDLKGANILINQTGHACLADFGLLTIISDSTSSLPSSSGTQDGTIRWMSPELINPQLLGLKRIHPTKSSDCYAFGMVIYETISGHLPFHRYTNPIVLMKILEDERPPREVGFTDSLWEVLELCWVPQPIARPDIEDVLQYLESISQSLEPPFPWINQEVDKGNDCNSVSNSSAHSTSSSAPSSPGASSNTPPSLNYNPLPPASLGIRLGGPSHAPDQGSLTIFSAFPSQESGLHSQSSSTLTRSYPHYNLSHPPTLGFKSFRFDPLYQDPTAGLRFDSPHWSTASFNSPHWDTTSFDSPNWGTTSFNSPNWGTASFNSPNWGAISFDSPNWDTTLIPRVRFDPSNWNVSPMLKFNSPHWGTTSFDSPNWGTTLFNSPNWSTPLLINNSSSPSQKPLSPPTLVIPDLFLSMNTEDPQTSTPPPPTINSPQLHIIPVMPISGGSLPKTLLINDPAEIFNPLIWNMGAAPQNLSFNIQINRGIDVPTLHWSLDSGQDFQKAQNEVQASSAIDSAGLSSGNLIGSGPPDSTGNFMLME